MRKLIPHLRKRNLLLALSVFSVLTISTLSFKLFQNGNAFAFSCPCSIWSNTTIPANPSANDTSSVELGLKFKSDVSGYVTGVRFYKGVSNTGTHTGALWDSNGNMLATITFTNETSSGWQSANFPNPVAISANTTYVVSYHAPNGSYAADANFFTNSGVDNAPLHALQSVSGNQNGVFVYSPGGIFPTSSFNDTNYYVDVIFQQTLPPPPDSGPGGPILVVTSNSSPYSLYYGEILSTEGLNEYKLKDISTVTSSILNNYDVVLVPPMALTSSQVSMFTNWATSGGKLVTIRPDKQFATTLGLTDLSSTLSNEYLLINTSASPGKGLVNQTIQYHDAADLYSLNGATSIATLYSNANTATSSPAVTTKSIGTSGGVVASFTYDLAKSIVETRQGNPAWAGQARDTANTPPIRAYNLFFGGSSSPDWIDFNKIQIPQADEQQRLLANMITSFDLSKKPLPKFWYFPNGKKAVIMMSGDDHGNGGTIGRFNTYLADSPQGCNVALWQCIRSSSYVYPSTPITQAQAQTYTNDGFEIGVHVTTGCNDYTFSALDNDYIDQLSQWSATFSNIPAPSSNRLHCVAWSDWASQAKVEYDKGIRLDANYYYYPSSWIQNRPGLFTGTGMPMRFTDLNGSIIDVYQTTTQMTDESGQTYPFTANTLLDNALGPLGYYGVFTANFHTDQAASAESDATISSALSRGVPVVSGRQLLQWLDGRNNSSFSNISWANSKLTFAVNVGAGATNLIQAMVPLRSSNKTLTTIMTGGTNVPYTTDLIKGVYYAFFPASSATYVATYVTDTTSPTVTSTNPGSGATGITVGSTINATFSKSIDYNTLTTSTFKLFDPNNSLVSGSVSYNAATQTATFSPSSSLQFSTTYHATIVSGTNGVKDLAGNALLNDFNWSFTTAAPNCPCTIWNSSTTPTNLDANDNSAVEVGVKFQSDISGKITGVRFYKGSTNTGTHTGELWDSNGNLLASATFSNETSSGWQQVNFTTPVNISANTVYVASYHTNVGQYSYDSTYFASSGVDNAPLHALKDGVSGGDGVFNYAASATFPSASFNSTNYWVDPVFTP